MPDTANELTSSNKLAQEVAVATDAYLGVIAIRCPDADVYRVVDDLYTFAMAQEIDFKVHTSETGWASYPRMDANDPHAQPFNAVKPSETDRGTAGVGEAFSALYDSLPSEGFYVFLDIFHQLAEPLVQTRIRKQVQRAIEQEQRVFIIVPHSAEIPPSISALLHTIDVDLPTRQELLTTLEDIIHTLDKEEQPELSDEEKAEIVSNGSGMTTTSFEIAVALSIAEYGVKYETRKGFGYSHIVDMIREYKTQALRATNALELQSSVDEDQIGGLDLFKAWMNERANTYTERAKEAHILPSRGALVVGPPGAGKSLVAKAAGSILHLPVIRFDVGRVFGQYVGQSEAAMRGVLSMLDAMSPVVLMLDEIDKGFSGISDSTGSGGGTTVRVFGTFLTWMQERDQRDRPIFLIMTANRIEGLPPELLRRGRLDEIWAVDMPNDDERVAILNIHALKRGYEIASDMMPALVRLTTGLVGAEIEAMIEDALVLSLNDDEPSLAYKWLEKARNVLKPMSETREADFKAMQKWAVQNARPSSSPVGRVSQELKRPTAPALRSKKRKRRTLLKP